MYIIQVTDDKGVTAYAYENENNELFLAHGFSGLIKQFGTEKHAKKAAQKKDWHKHFIVEIKRLTELHNLGTKIEKGYLVGAERNGEIYGYVHYDVAQKVYFIDVSEIGACFFEKEYECGDFIVSYSPSKIRLLEHNLVGVPLSKLNS